MNSTEKSRHSTTLRRIGTVGFVLFLVKGLLWLAAPIIFLGAGI